MNRNTTLTLPEQLRAFTPAESGPLNANLPTIRYLVRVFFSCCCPCCPCCCAPSCIGCGGSSSAGCCCLCCFCLGGGGGGGGGGAPSDRCSCSCFCCQLITLPSPALVTSLSPPAPTPAPTNPAHPRVATGTGRMTAGGVWVMCTRVAGVWTELGMSPANALRGPAWAVMTIGVADTTAEDGSAIAGRTQAGRTTLTELGIRPANT